MALADRHRGEERWGRSSKVGRQEEADTRSNRTLFIAHFVSKVEIRTTPFPAVCGETRRQAVCRFACRRAVVIAARSVDDVKAGQRDMRRALSGCRFQIRSRKMPSRRGFDAAARRTSSVRSGFL